jgi:hypothetical protein
MEFPRLDTGMFIDSSKSRVIRNRNVFCPTMKLFSITVAPSRYDVVRHLVETKSFPTKETGMMDLPQFFETLIRREIVGIVVLDTESELVPNIIRWEDKGVAVFLDVVLPVEVVLPAEGLEGFVEGSIVFAWQGSPVISVQPTVGFAPRRTRVILEPITYSCYFVGFVDFGSPEKVSKEKTLGGSDEDAEEKHEYGDTHCLVEFGLWLSV